MAHSLHIKIFSLNSPNSQFLYFDPQQSFYTLYNVGDGSIYDFEHISLQK